MLRSNNPFFRKALNQEVVDTDSVPATYKGVALKTVFYLLMTLLGAILGILLLNKNPEAFVVFISVSGIFTFIFSLVGMMIPKASMVFGSLYCLCQGVLIGFLSLLFEAVVSGVILATLVSTFTVLLVIVTLFMTGLVKVNSKFLKVVLTITLSVLISQFILYIFALVTNLQFNFGYNLLASILMTFVACLYLFLDLNNVINIVEGGYPKEYEWYAAFGLVFTILWIYLEVLPIVFRILGNRN